MNKLFEAIDSLEAFILNESSDDVNTAYEYLYDRFNSDIAKLIWDTYNDEKKTWWLNNWLEGFEGGFEDDYGYPEDEYKQHNKDWEYTAFDYFCDDANMGPEIALDDLSDDQLLSVYQKAINMNESNKLNENDLSLDLGDGKHVYINADGDELPYIGGYSDDDIDIADRYDLSDEELWATGWVASVQNDGDRPFNSFDEIELAVFDNEKGDEYSLPCELPDDFKARFVKEVNDYTEE